MLYTSPALYIFSMAIAVPNEKKAFYFYRDFQTILSDFKINTILLF